MTMSRRLWTLAQTVRNLDEILRVDEIDVYFVGPGDLSSSMNLPTEHPSVQDTIKKCIRKIAASGRIAGTYVGNADAARQTVSWGARYLVTAITPYLVQGATTFLADVKETSNGGDGVHDIY